MGGSFEAYLSGPFLPATVLMIVILVYWLLVILGALDLDFLDFDIDVDADADSFFSFGFVAMRFLNIGDIPLVIWASAFALGLWTVTWLMGMWVDYEETSTALAVAGNAVLAAILAKAVTAPMKGRFEPQEPHRTAQLIGRTCQMHSEVTQTCGQAEFKTNGAPLLLNVRVKQGRLAKGEWAEITEYDSETHLYFVEPIEGEI